MDYSDIRKNIEAKKYDGDIAYPDMKRLKLDTILDPTRSIIWNKDKVQEHNDTLDAHLTMYKMSERAAEQRFIDDCLDYAASKICNETSMLIYNEDLQPIYNLAYEEGHSAGYSEVLNYLGEYVDTFAEVLKRIEKNNKDGGER